jgi:YegS/Rv2252/BmrU family lipid kinase
MIKIKTIVLASRKINPDQTGHGQEYSAMQSVAGKPVLEWTIDALCGSVGIDNILVIGPDALDKLLCIRYVDKRLAPSAIATERIFQELFPRQANDAIQGYLLLPCESVLLTTAIINRILLRFEQSREDLFFTFISDTHADHFPHINKNMFPLKGKQLIPGYLGLSRSTKYLPALFKTLDEFNDQAGLLDNSGITRSMLSTMTEQSSLSPSIHYYECNDPEVTFAAFTLDDLRYAQKVLRNSMAAPFTRVKVILNPGSGKNGDKGRWRNKKSKGINCKQCSEFILSTLYQSRIDAEIIQSTSSTDATGIARQCAKEGYDLVIAAGGDGTINSVVNGLAGSQTALGIIPLGTINLMAMELKIPNDLESACRIIAHGRLKTIDLGKVNDRFFTSLCGIGFDAYVIGQTQSSLKKQFGSAAFIINGIKNLIRYPFHSIRLCINQKIYKSGYIVIVGNGKYYGASVLIAPGADNHDGLLDVVIFQKKDSLSLLRYIWELHKGDLTALPDVEHIQAKHISIERHGHHKLHVDGEYYGKTPVEISVVPSALKVVC